MTDCTQYVHPDRTIEDPYAPTSVPIYQTATFGQSHADTFDDFDYSRSANPTRRVLEDQLAKLERTDRAFAFASGMAALSALLRLCQAGDEVLVGDGWLSDGSAFSYFNAGPNTGEGTLSTPVVLNGTSTESRRVLPSGSSGTAPNEVICSEVNPVPETPTTKGVRSSDSTRMTQSTS